MRPKKYFSDLNDPIDVALGEFVNNREAIPIAFTRETTGVYHFGSRRVFMKLESGRLIVNVGGGFMTPEELVTSYTQSEIDKQAGIRVAKLCLTDRVVSSYGLRR